MVTHLVKMFLMMVVIGMIWKWLILWIFPKPTEEWEERFTQVLRSESRAIHLSGSISLGKLGRNDKNCFFFFLLFKFHVDCLICSATNGPPDLGKANLRFRGEITSCHLPGDRPVIMIMPLVMMVMMMACRHIPTMTISHHGGEMSVMIKVGMCQCQIHTIHDKLQLHQLALVSYSTRPLC